MSTIYISQLLFPLRLQPFVGFGFLRQVILRFRSNKFFQGKVVGLSPNPQPGGGQSPELISPWGRVAQLYPRALGSWGTSGVPLPIPTNVGP
jgi:hypothetical protein